MNYKTRLKDITTIVLDVDGVLTNGDVFLDSSGQMLRTMNTRDGFAMKTAIDKGYKICVITGGNSPQVKKRLNYLGIYDVFLEVKDKMAVLKKYLKKNKITFEQILYVGDDIPDYEPIKHASIGVAPNDACEEILAIADYVSHKNGGRGCVREILEQVMKIRGDWFDPK